MPDQANPVYYQQLLMTTIFTTVLVVTFAAAQANFPLMRDLALARHGQDTALEVENWQAQIEAMRSLPDDQKLAQANRFFNTRSRWTQDPEIWGENDYWATPLELMGRGMGDCEDFAIAKYVTRVLAYHPSATEEPVILDTLITDIRPATTRPGTKLSRWRDLLRRAAAEGLG